MLRFENRLTKQVISTVRSRLIYGTVRTEENNFGLLVLELWSQKLKDSTLQLVFPRHLRQDNSRPRESLCDRKWNAQKELGDGRGGDFRDVEIVLTSIGYKLRLYYQEDREPKVREGF